jgi:hypothetical protein
MNASDRKPQQFTTMSDNPQQTNDENIAMQASKPKPAAKSIVTLDIKPWGMSFPQAYEDLPSLSLLTSARR